MKDFNLTPDTVVVYLGVIMTYGTLKMLNTELSIFKIANDEDKIKYFNRPSA